MAATLNTAFDGQAIGAVEPLIISQTQDLAPAGVPPPTQSEIATTLPPESVTPSEGNLSP